MCLIYKKCKRGRRRQEEDEVMRMCEGEIAKSRSGGSGDSSMLVLVFSPDREVAHSPMIVLVMIVIVTVVVIIVVMSFT